MVNRGKPSRGCQNCKNRRIKCDETKPQCKKCVNTGRVCPGVPEDFDLVFRDQTKSVSRKAQRSEPRASGQTSRKSSTPSAHSVSENNNELQIVSAGAEHVAHLAEESLVAHTIQPEIFLSTQNQAVAYFFQQYVNYPRKSTQRAGPYLDYLGEIYASAPKSSAIDLAVNATALLAFSHHYNTSCLKDKASSIYCRALRVLSTAINDSKMAKSDATLMSVLVLSMYENMLGKYAQGFSTWVRHLEGAIALIRYRGTDQVNTHVSAKLFRAVRFFMIQYYTLQSRSLPAFAGNKSWTFDEELVTSNEPGYWNLMAKPQSMTHNWVHLANLRARCRRLFQNPEPDRGQVLEIFAEAEAIEKDAVAQRESMPDQYSYRTVPCFCALHASHPTYEHPACPTETSIEEGEIWLGNPLLHVYKTPEGSLVHNILRTLRIYANAIAARCLQWLLSQGEDLEMTFLYDAALHTIQTNIDEICASVPFQMGNTLSDNLYENEYQATPLAEPDSPKEHRGNPAVNQGAYFLLYPLQISLMAETISEQQREWIRNRLRVLASVYGIQQAKVMVGTRPCLIECGLTQWPGCWQDEWDDLPPGAWQIGNFNQL